MKSIHDVDAAIDRVAKQMTRVEDDHQLAARIVASLPQRATWLGWLTTSWAPRLAAIVVVAGASVLMMNRQSPATDAVLPSSSTMVASIARRPAVEPLAPPSRTKPLEPLALLEPLEPEKADHEFSLPGLDVESLTPLSVSTVDSIELAPLAIADLPLSGEFSEREKE